MNAQQYFKLLNIIHKALLGGQLVFMIVSVFLVLSGTFEAFLAEERNLFFIIVAIMAAGGLFAGNFLYNKQLNSIIQLNDFIEQFTKMRALIIMRLALLEGPTILAIIFYLLTGSWLFLLFAAVLLLLFLKLKPDKEKIIEELEFSEEKKRQLADPNTIVANKTHDK